MNKQEIGQLLTMAALIDNRTVTPEAALMWHGIIGHVDYQPAVEAMQDHFRESGEWLMPSHILQRVKTRRRLELGTTMSPEAPTECPNGAHRRVADGTCMYCTDRPSDG